jgi:hypothetical protein
LFRREWIMPLKNGMQERKHPRRPYSNVIKFCVNPRCPNVIFDGVGINISDSGISLYTSANLHKGDVIVIQDALPVKYRKATVIWVKEYQWELYRVGLTFLE